MAEPPGKKQKMDLTGPFTFTRHNKKPDTLLNVFGVEYHVDSMVLKTNSRYFHAFMDPSNSARAMPRGSSAFTYEWYTEIDKDNDKDWYLSSTLELRNADLSGFGGDKADEQAVFTKLLYAIFGISYQIKDAAQLSKMTARADYYQCLPALSNSLSNAFYNSPKVVNSIPDAALSLLQVAYKLRHKVLFKEAFIHVLGPWAKPQWQQLKDPQLLQLASNAESRIKHMLLGVHSSILQFHSSPTVYGHHGSNFANVASLCRDNIDGHIMQPAYFREIYQSNYSKDVTQSWIEKTLGPLLESNLQLDRSNLGSGEGRYADFFLCGNVWKYPWAESERDW